MLLIFGCEQSTGSKASQKKNDLITHQNTLPSIAPINGEKGQINKEKEILPASAFMLAEWIDLMPEDDLDALLNAPSYIDDIVDGSAEDKLSNKFKSEPENYSGDRYQQALVSTRVKPMLNNAPIRLPAFIVPLEFDDEQNVTQFFMVPFFGACLHLPPPPPNQMIFVNYPQGFKLTSLYDTYWISGILTTSLVENDMATAAYSMDMHAFELYTDE